MLVLVPFAVTQVRQTLYPVLERPGEIAAATGGFSVPSSMPMAAAAPEPEAAGDAPVPMAEANIAGEPNVANAPQAMRDEAKSKMVSKSRRAISKQDYYEGSRSKSNANYQQQIQQQQNQMLDPNHKVQTGPGLPDWQWSDHRLIWSGPVEAGQSLHLWLLSPAANGVLTVLRLVVLLLLLARLCNLNLCGYLSCLRRCCWPRRTGSTGNSSAAAMLLCLFATLLLTPHSAQAADLPDSEMLQQLQQKLTAPPDCLPQCAQISRLGVYATASSLQLRLEAHAETDTAIPLPGGVNQWLADQVLLNGKPAAGLQRDDAGTVWVALTRGVHEITLASGLAKRDVVQIALPLKPNRIEARLEQWSLEGLTADGRAGENLILSRSNPQAGSETGGDGNLPPFVRVERTFSLGLVWLVSTEVIRVGLGLAPVLVEIPLLKGESVTSGDVKVEQGKAFINLGRTHNARFESTLQEAPQLELTASNAPNQIQHWRLDLGPQWHATLSGIPVVQHQDANARWLPEWRPWPGEKVTLALSKPAGIAGQTLTLDQSRVQLSPGIRATDVSLNLVLRSSQAGQHSLTLPEGASLQSVRINGQLQPIRQEGRRVNLPISPGRQEINLAWRESTGMRTAFTSPAIDVGLRGVNSRLQLTIPPDRWTLLLSGPRLGPAILFWGVVIVLAGIAAGLGRWRITPLRGRHWFLLGLGLAPVSWGLSALVMGWLLALGARRRWREAPTRRWLFNLMQIGLAAWTLLALLCLFWAVQQGLLGYPDMQITGNGSSTRSLNWFADRHGTMLPTAWVLSIPLWAYRVLMLLWASWLAYALLGWVKWAWESYCGGVGLWVRRPAKVKPNNLDTAPAAETAAVPLAGTSTPGADTVAGKDTPDSEG